MNGFLLKYRAHATGSKLEQVKHLTSSLLTAMAGASTVQSGPMSVKEISAKAEDFEFNPSIALKYWLRTADTLLREVGLSLRFRAEVC